MGAVNCKAAYDDLVQSIESPVEPSDSCLPWFANVPVDANGCRVFPRIPPPGNHPRLFFTAEEIPYIIARFTNSPISDRLQKLLHSGIGHFNKFCEQFEALDDSEQCCPTEQTLREFFTINEGRNTAFLATYISAFISCDIELMSKVTDMVVFYAKVVINSRNFAIAEEVNEKPFDYWHTRKWDVASPWLTGGTSIAILYDVMFQDMTEEQRQVIRECIAVSCHGRQSWGMNFPGRRIQSNWGPYNSQLYVMLSAIEEEDGFDDEPHANFENILKHYMDHAVYDSGHPVEDAYALNFGFREGSYALLASARRGFNLFNHPNFKKIWTNWLPLALEPQMSGLIYGGSSGSDWEYPTSALIAKYVFPRDRVIDFVYRKFMSPGSDLYQRLLKYQARVPALIFALPVNDAESNIDDQAIELDLPLTFRCENRGKVAMRSDWTENALWFTLDARPDCFFIGHDAPSRGGFTLNMGGRPWAVCPEWNFFRESRHYSVPLIGDVGQAVKAPFVHLMPPSEDESDEAEFGNTCFASADLSYAYNWEWTQWKNNCPNGFQPEPHDPREFGMSAWWLPHKIHEERNVGFMGLQQWRKRFQEVAQVTRSALMIRSPVPYMILADTVKKDEAVHEYKWAMTTPSDVELESFDGQDAILVESEEPRRRLLIRYLHPGESLMECGFKKFSNEGEGVKNIHEFGRLVFTVSASEASFWFMVYELTDDSSPCTSWASDCETLEVAGVDGLHKEVIAFGKGDKNEDIITLVSAESA